ncbi:MAG: hypothetical protein HC929_11055 [Leptolyngbyaceae cyanobacterium SM2_5_2]|nr:hypothetical protein [Leptolyngbyaceae cyanobacterium SM2_5_2]
MNASFPSESTVQPAAPTAWPQPTRQAPSVPISVYRELATELKATQALVESLTQQNQQLGQQNQVLRKEMLRFAESAAQLKQAVEASAPLTELVARSAPLVPIEMSAGAGMVAAQLRPEAISAEPHRQPSETESAAFPLEGVSGLTNQFTQMLKPKTKPAAKVAKSAPKPPAKRPQPVPPPQMLYTEERLEPSRPGQTQEKKG